MSKRSGLIVVGGSMAFLMLAGAGCGQMVAQKAAQVAVQQSSGGQVNFGTNGSITVNTNEGTYSDVNKVPDNWPSDVAVYAGSKVVYSGSSNNANSKPGFALALQTSDKAQAVVDFYKDSLAKAGWNITSNGQFNGTTIIAAQKGTNTLGLTVTEADGQTSISISIEGQ